ncbi:MAG: hypothetical protein R2873_03465 [Caldilineaceae bacterium]
MKMLTVIEAKERLQEILHEPGSEQILILQDGEPIGLLSPLTDPVEIERLKMAFSAQLHAILAEGRREIAEGNGIRHDDFWKDLDDDA